MNIRSLCLLLSLTACAVGCGGGEKAAQEETPQPKAVVESKTEPESSRAEPQKDIALTPEERLGKRIFLLCTACHNLKEGEPHKVGPNLHGIFGAKAGMKEGFTYSEALKSTDITWNEDEMRAWIENPTAYVPGTNMAFIGLTKKKQQDALITYLRAQTK